MLNEPFLLNLHKRMFGKVWTWAGTLRKGERNIGVAAYRISTELRTTLDDVRYWIEHETYPPDEIAVKFHHRLVWVHPFLNGNGRHARLAADLLAVALGRPRFSWGRTSLVEAASTRAQPVGAGFFAGRGLRRRLRHSLRFGPCSDFPDLAFVRRVAHDR